MDGLSASTLLRRFLGDCPSLIMATCIIIKLPSDDISLTARHIPLPSFILRLILPFPNSSVQHNVGSQLLSVPRSVRRC